MKRNWKVKLTAGMMACLLAVGSMPLALAYDDTAAPAPQADVDASVTIDRDALQQDVCITIGVACMLSIILK